MAVLSAAWINAVIDRYNSQLGTNLAHINVGDLWTAAFFNNIIATVATACSQQNRTCALPPLVSVGEELSLYQFPDTVQIVANGSVSYSTVGTFTWTVPQYVTSVQVNWIIGGGGGGGSGTQGGYGGGGGGGGAGGFKQYYTIPSTPGDKWVITVGAGGAASPNPLNNSQLNGLAGSSTTIAINNIMTLVATGGAGGTGSQNFNQGAIPAPGGVGGNFQSTQTGLSGQGGQIGTNDHASSYGGAGAPGPIQGALGGAGGLATGGGPMTTGPSSGKAGVGYGSGGGGGGAADRSGYSGTWSGGAGQSGYVELSWPASGSGATPAQNNSGYSSATVAPGATGGGYTGGSGYGTTNANGVQP